MYGLWILLMFTLYSLFTGGFQEILDFLESLDKRRERKRAKKK